MKNVINLCIWSEAILLFEGWYVRRNHIFVLRLHIVGGTRKLGKSIDWPIPRNCAATMASHPLGRLYSFYSCQVAVLVHENSLGRVNFSWHASVSAVRLKLRIRLASDRSREIRRVQGTVCDGPFLFGVFTPCAANASISGWSVDKPHRYWSCFSSWNYPRSSHLTGLR